MTPPSSSLAAGCSRLSHSTPKPANINSQHPSNISSLHQDQKPPSAGALNSSSSRSFIFFPSFQRQHKTRLKSLKYALNKHTHRVVKSFTQCPHRLYTFRQLNIYLKSGLETVLDPDVNLVLSLNRKRKTEA